MNRQSNSAIKRKRKSSLKDLAILDKACPNNNRPTGDVPDELKETCKEKDNVDSTTVSIAQQAPTSSNWPDDEVLSDSELLAYTTPLKNSNGQNQNVKNAISSEVSTSSHSFSNDSWLNNVDLALLENECLNQLGQENSTAGPLQPILMLHQANSPTASVNNNPHKLKDQKLFTASTPKTDQKNSLTTKLRKRLVENAYNKTPRSGNSISLSHADEKREEMLCDSVKLTTCIEEMSTQDIGPFYGLPSKFKQLLESLRGIKKLYDWQDHCLTRKEIKAGKNLVYTLPTSGGKTLVAEILILQALLCHKKNALLVLPFVAIVQEKIQSLSQFAVELGFLIEEYAGSKGKFPPTKRRMKNVLYVCTIEKANTLINSLIENKRLDELKLIVVDELHMIGSAGRRGATIEAMLAKLLYLSAPVQIVGMSATLSNTNELGTFLCASVYHNDFRPVQLEEYVKVADCVFRVYPDKLHLDDQLIKERTLSHSSKQAAVADPDNLTCLVGEIVPQHSCLVFCPSKKNCENVAILLCKGMPEHLTVHCRKEKIDILRALRNDSGSICPTLLKVIPYGVAYHHSGLTADERHIIEEGYREGILTVITCTSTLAAGVNLPARRVIIRSPHIGRDVMTSAQYKQMIGRAGRAGIDSKGESYLVVPKSQDRTIVPNIVAGQMETCRSSLLYDQGKGFQALILNLIALKVVLTTSEILSFFSHTLCAQQLKMLISFQPEWFEDVNTDETAASASVKLVEKSLNNLLDLELIEKSSDGDDCFNPTKLGIATSKCGIDFNLSQPLYQDLKSGLEGLVLDNYLHLLYLVTPYDAAINISPCWMDYMDEMDRLSESELSVATFVGVPPHYIMRRASGQHPTRNNKTDEKARRFYVTLMLYHLFKGLTVWDVSVRFGQPRGFIQSLSISAAAFASSVLRFSQEFEQFWPYHGLLEKLVEVLQYSRISALVPLLEIATVKLARAKQLHRAGYKSLSTIASANPEVLMLDIDHLSRRQAQQIVASAKVLLAEKINVLEEEMEGLRSMQ